MSDKNNNKKINDSSSKSMITMKKISNNSDVGSVASSKTSATQQASSAQQHTNRGARLSNGSNGGGGGGDNSRYLSDGTGGGGLGLWNKCARVELMLSAKNLKDKDVLSKSDPICVVQQLSLTNSYRNGSIAGGAVAATRSNSAMSNGSGGGPRWLEIGRTEVVYNNLSPEWNTKIYVDYYFEAQQRLRFDIYDVDSVSRDLTKHDFLGRCECHLARIIAAPSGTVSLKLTDEPDQQGVLTIRAEEVDEGQKENAHFECQALGVSGRRGKKGWCLGLCPTDAFLEFYRLYPNGVQQLVHRTEVYRAVSSTPVEWKPFEITVRHLCEADKDREFLIKCFDYRFHGRHKLLGMVKTSISSLVHGQRQLELEQPVFDEELHQLAALEISPNEKTSILKQLKKKRAESAERKRNPTLIVVGFHVRREFTWLEYIASGLQLEFAVAVDFTASNGQPSEPTSLHHTDRRFFNQYEAAIRAVLEVCEHYNATKAFEAFGFGAKTPPSWEVSHFFPLDFVRRQPRVYGVQGVIEAYRVALSRVELAGPTCFEPCIKIFHQKCQKMPRDGSRYQILLILTNGKICDMRKTTHAVIDASDQPLSIVIVGVGEAGDFTQMEQLDSDERLLELDGRIARRDIVQFVPFRDFIDATAAGNAGVTRAHQSAVRARLAREVLAEVPFQVTSFMKANGIVPKNASSTFSGK